MVLNLLNEKKPSHVEKISLDFKYAFLTDILILKKILHRYVMLIFKALTVDKYYPESEIFLRKL